MKVKKTTAGNIKITLSPEQAGYLQEILNVSHSTTSCAPAETDDFSWELWGVLKKGD